MNNTDQQVLKNYLSVRLFRQNLQPGTGPGVSIYGTLCILTKALTLKKWLQHTNNSMRLLLQNLNIEQNYTVHPCLFNQKQTKRGPVRHQLTQYQMTHILVYSGIIIIPGNIVVQLMLTLIYPRPGILKQETPMYL